VHKGLRFAVRNFYVQFVMLRRTYVEVSVAGF